MSTRPAPCFVRFRYKIAGLKDLAFELQVPADPAFRPIAAEAAGKYGESVGLGGDEARALEVSLQRARCEGHMRNAACATAREALA